MQGYVFINYNLKISFDSFKKKAFEKVILSEVVYDFLFNSFPKFGFRIAIISQMIICILFQQNNFDLKNNILLTSLLQYSIYCKSESNYETNAHLYKQS